MKKICPNCKNEMVWVGSHSEGLRKNSKVVNIYYCRNCKYADDDLDNTPQILKTDPSYKQKRKRFIKNWDEYSRRNK